MFGTNLASIFNFAPRLLFLKRFLFVKESIRFIFGTKSALIRFQLRMNRSNQLRFWEFWKEKT